MLDLESPFSRGAPANDKAIVAERALRAAIIAGELAPGQKLSEVVLCRQYAVGRGSIRAALVRLAQSGLVSSRARSGWSVAPVSTREIREVIMALRHLEPVLVRTQLRPEDLTRLETLSGMHAALAGQADIAADAMGLARRYEREMRELLADRLNAPLIARWLADIWDKAARLVGFFEQRSMARLPLADWSALIEALRSGHVQAAEKTLAQMLAAIEVFMNGCFLELEATLSEPVERRISGSRKANAPAPSIKTQQQQKRTN